MPGVLLALVTWTGCDDPVVGIMPVPDGTLHGPFRTDWPDGPTLGAALPGPGQVGGLGGFSSCLAGTEPCSGADLDDRDLSWVRAQDMGGDDGGRRWVEMTVQRYTSPESAQEQVAEARAACPPGEFGGQGSPQGFNPRPPSGSNVRRQVVAERGLFRGTRCVEEVRSSDAVASESGDHVLVVARELVVLTVSGSSEERTLRLFEEYVDRLDRS